MSRKKQKQKNFDSLLLEINRLGPRVKKIARIPGLDSYSPSYVTNGADNQVVPEWVIGNKS